MAGISRVLRPGGARRVTLGGGVGGSHVHNDGTSSWETKAMVGVMASFRAPFDSGMLRLDGFLDWMPHATIIGVAVGIEAGF